MLQLPSRVLLGLLERDAPAPVAALGSCATKMPGRGAAPAGPGAQEKLQKGEESPPSAAEGGLEQLCEEYWISLGDITAPYTDLPAQSPCQDQKDFGG